MAQQNQEINLVDPGSFPLRRKRGRPRKYDGPGYEARRRYLSPQSIPNPANLVGSSQGPSLIPSRVNSNLTLNFSPQATSVQANPTVHPYAEAHIIPTQLNPVPISSVRPEAIPAQPTTVSGFRNMQSQANAKYNATSSLHYEIGAFPVQSMRIANSSSSHCIPPASSSHASHTLVGQSVSGILDGTFDAGYMLTVQVGSTGDMLKGLVFDPHLCVPVSAENDIAPLLPLANSRENLNSVSKTPIQEPVSTPIHAAPTLVTVALPVQTREPPAPQPVNHVLVSSAADVSKINCESILLKLATIDSNPGCHEEPKTLQTEVQTTIPPSLTRETVNSENKTSLLDGTQQTAENNATSETLLCPAVSKETDQSQPDQNLHLTEASAVDKSQVQNDKPSPCMDEELGKAESVQQREELTENENKEPEGEQGQNLEVPTSGPMPEVSSAETSDKQTELPGTVVGH